MKLIQYKVSEWEDESGYWHIGCVDGLGQNYNAPYYPARILGISPAAYIEKMVKQYNAIVYHHSLDYSFIFFKWKNVADARKWKNWFNKYCREKNIQIPV